MATKSRIVEAAFRIGSGRYIQEAGAISQLGAEVARLHCRKPLLIGTPTALSLTEMQLVASLTEAGMTCETLTYRGFCDRDAAAKIAADAAFSACDLVVGIGGGNVCDLAKLVAASTDRPVITVPTSSATCAAFTPLSVTYTAEGRTNGTVHHKKEVDAMLVDTDVLCRQPERLFAAGVYDAAAKLIETSQRMVGKTEDELDIGLTSSFALSEFIYRRMFELMDEATADLRAGKNTKALSDMVYMTIAVTGVISGMARGSNQCALAHKIYETTRFLFPAEVHDKLHGEMVAIGLLAQLYYNGEPEKVAAFRAGLASHGLPTSLAELGVPSNDDATMEAYYEKLLASTAMAGTEEAEHLRLREALQIIR